LPIVPTARRTFATTDRVTAFVRVYRSRPDSAAPAVTAQVIDASGGVAHEETLDPDGSGSDYQLDLPLERFAPGEYLLQIGASAGDDKVAGRVRFRVE
jgi:hypothetical protein